MRIINHSSTCRLYDHLPPDLLDIAEQLPAINYMQEDQQRADPCETQEDAGLEQENAVGGCKAFGHLASAPERHLEGNC